jgi:hypothetical protein
VRAFIMGAGASNDAGYPLGTELLREIDSYVCGSGRCFNRFDYSKEWPETCRWLEVNENLLVREAYRTGNLESLFTTLDFIEQLRQQRLDAVARHITSRDEKAAKQADGDWGALNDLTAKYYEARRILLWALEQFLEYKHQNDRWASEASEWNYLHTFGCKLQPGDVLVTFNYDSTMERVLYKQGKWFPSDGYGFKVVFQRSRHAEDRVEFPTSAIRILHLHGAIGWYRKPAIKDYSLLPEGGGAFPREALTPAPLETEIGLDPMFLENLGVPAVDASLPVRPGDERQIFIHPSFLKNYEYEGGRNRVFVQLWNRAAEDLRMASEVFIIGYSLPDADSAALTLLLTTCVGKNVRLVNNDPVVNHRLNLLLGQSLWRRPISFQQWLAGIEDRAV